MTAAAPRPVRRDFDWALSLLSLAGALFCTWLLAQHHEENAARSEAPIATLTLARAQVRRRPLGLLAWNHLDPGAAVYDLDSVFVPPGSAASLTFENGSRLEVEENSLVVINRPASSEGAQTQVQLIRGRASGISGKGGMELRGTNWVTNLPAQAGAMVNLQPGKPAHVEVFAGTAHVKTNSGAHALEENQAADIAANGTLESARFSVALTSPLRSARLYFQASPPPVVFAWKQSEAGALRVQIASDRGFREVILDAPVIDGTLRFQPLGSGTFWWRVASADGQPRSEVRTLELLEDRAPIPSSPGLDEQIDTHARSITLTWSAVQNAPGYRVEISKQEDFGSLVKWRSGWAAVRYQVEVQAPGMAVAKSAPQRPGLSSSVTTPGRYEWRVRAEDVEGGTSEWSTRGSFVLAPPVQEVVVKVVPPAPLAAPSLVAPKDQAVLPRTQTIELNWEQVPRAAAQRPRRDRHRSEQPGGRWARQHRAARAALRCSGSTGAGRARTNRSERRRDRRHGGEPRRVSGPVRQSPGRAGRGQRAGGGEGP